MSNREHVINIQCCFRKYNLFAFVIKGFKKKTSFLYTNTKIGEIRKDTELRIMGW
jgi:hypothetical protein